MISKDTAKATNAPTSNKNISLEAILSANIMYFIPFNKDAPNITGIDKKNENSQETLLLHIYIKQISEPTRLLRI